MSEQHRSEEVGPERPILLQIDNYLESIRSAAQGDNQMFRHFWAIVDGEKRDITKRGELSCALFVSSLLKMQDFDLWPQGKRRNLTVNGVAKSIQEVGWIEVGRDKIQPGCIVVWGLGEAGHKHIGFALSSDSAVSTSSNGARVVQHDITFDGKREIEAIFFNPKLGEWSF